MKQVAGDVHDMIADKRYRVPQTNLKIMGISIEGIVTLHSFGFCYADLKPNNKLYFTDILGFIRDYKLIDFNNTFHNSRPQDARYSTPQTMSPDIFQLVEGTNDAIAFAYKVSDYWNIGYLSYFSPIWKASSWEGDTIDKYRVEN